MAEITLTPLDDDTPPAKPPARSARTPAPPITLTPLEDEKPAPGAAAPSRLEALWHGLLRGGRDILEGGAQIGVRMGPEEGGAAFTNPADLAARKQVVDKAVQQSAKDYSADPARRAYPITAGLGRLGGNVLATAPLAAVPGIASAGVGAGVVPRLVAGGALGALGGAMTPVTNPQNFGREKALQIGLGAGGGAASTGALQAVGGVLGPRLSADISKLRGQNVSLPPGRVLGGPLGWFEKHGTDFPILGNWIQGKESKSFESFNRATINQALEPIGEKLPDKSPWGHVSIRSMNTAIDKAYDEALKPITKVSGDADLGSALGRLKTLAQKKPEVWSNFEPEWQAAVDAFKDGKTMSGREIKQTISSLGRDARNYARSDDYNKRELAARFNDLKSLYSDLVQRQWPEEASKITAADKSYAMSLRIGQAASRRAGSEGKFTPMDLLQSSRSQSGGLRSKEFQQGDALFQDWAETANRVLPSKIPDSGTAGRLIATKPLHATGLGIGGALAYLPLNLAGKVALRKTGVLPEAGRDYLDELANITAPGVGTASAP